MTWDGDWLLLLRDCVNWSASSLATLSQAPGGPKMRWEKGKQAVVPRTLMKDDFFSRDSVYGWAALEIPRLTCDTGAVHA